MSLSRTRVRWWTSTGHSLSQSIAKKILYFSWLVHVFFNLVISSQLIFWIIRLPDSPEWTSAGCYFNSITPCQVCCTAPAWTNSCGGVGGRLNPPLHQPPHFAVGKVWPATAIPSTLFILALKHLSLITRAPSCTRDKEMEFSARQIKLKVLSLTFSTWPLQAVPQNMKTKTTALWHWIIFPSLLKCNYFI